MDEGSRRESNVVLFLDTNMLFDFRPLNEIDRTRVLGAKEVRLVLCSPVLDELDEKKYDPKTAQRARAAISQLKRIAGGEGHVREGVRLSTITDQEDPEANRDVGIIRRALDYAKEHLDRRVLVISDDFNMRVRCKTKHMESMELAEKWRKPVEDEKSKGVRLLSDWF